MDKTFLVFLAIGIGFLYFITHFVSGIQAEDEPYRNSAYDLKHKYDAYKGVDSVGREVLNVIGVDAKTQIAAWNGDDTLKQDFLDLYPDFGLMKGFIKNRVNGEPLQSRLLKQVDEIESKFFSGALSPEQAKVALKNLK